MSTDESGKSSKVAVVGGGAIGGITAAFIRQAGWDVELVAKHQNIVDVATGAGLRIQGMRGEHRIAVDACREIGELSGAKDVVFLAMKATDVADTARALEPTLADGGVVVSLQNGICEELLADILGRRRVIGCVTGWGATMVRPGVLDMTSPGEYVVGNIDHEEDDRLPPIAAMLEQVAPTRISQNIMGELYSKLIINSCINTLGALAGIRLGPLLADGRARAIFIRIMEEGMAVAAAMELHVEPGAGGKLDFYRFLGRESWVADFMRHAMIRVIGLKYRRIKSSSLQSLERGKPTEIDFLNGYICAKGKELGVPTPTNDRVVVLIKQIEAGDLSISPDNLDTVR